MALLPMGLWRITCPPSPERSWRLWKLRARRVVRAGLYDSTGGEKILRRPIEHPSNRQGFKDGFKDDVF